MKSHFKYLLIIPLCFLASLSNAQEKKTVVKDTIKVGVNDQLITVTPPELNQKVTVLLNDSTVDYKIEISKLSKTPTSKISNKKKISKKKKNVEKRYLNALEIGWNADYSGTFLGNHLPMSLYNRTAYSTDENSKYYKYSFKDEKKKSGIFMDINLLEKSKTLGKRKSWSYIHSNHLGINYCQLRGNVLVDIYQPRNTFIKDLGEYKFRTSYLSLRFGKVLTLRKYLTSSKNLSLDFGLVLDIYGQKNASSRIIPKGRVNNREDVEMERSYNYDEWETRMGKIGIMSRMQLAINYKRFFVNFTGKPTQFSLSSSYVFYTHEYGDNLTSSFSVGYRL